MSKRKMCIVIPHTGLPYLMELDFAGIQKTCGGNVQLITLHKSSIHAYCDEDALMKNPRPMTNPTAFEFCSRRVEETGRVLMGSNMYGNVVITMGNKDVNANLIKLVTDEIGMTDPPK